MSPDSQLPSIEVLQSSFEGYELEEILAHNGHSAVIQARQSTLDRPVAIKILSREVSADPVFRDAFTSEAKAMAQLKHPNLIGVYDFGDVDGMLYAVMELVEGGSLDRAAGQMPIDPVKAVDLCDGICRGLAHAHESGMLHGDLRPSTILLDSKLQPKLGQFGLERHLGNRGGFEAGSDAAPGYAAPEVISGGSPTERADLFSVGAILYRLLTGTNPDRRPLPKASSRCGCPPVFDAIIARATDHDSNRRYQSVAELAQSLKQATRSASQPVKHLPKPIPGPSPIPARTRASRPVSRPPRQLPQGVGTAILVLTLLIAAAIIYANREKEDPALPSRTEGAQAEPIYAIPSPEPNSRKNRVVKPAPRAEDPSKSLVRLKSQLAAGQRDELPSGAAAYHGSHFLVLPEVVLSWPEAQRFAEDHGAHLAVLPTRKDQDWFRDRFNFDRPLWLGAGRGARDEWQWVDASPWSPDNKIAGNPATHRGLALSSTGGIFPARRSQPHALALQWRDDGSNPATLQAQLGRTAESATAEDPDKIVYPVGTFSREDSHYYFYRKDMSWEDARKFAKSLGAYLAVPSSPKEHRWIAATFGDQLNGDQSSWLGGFRLSVGDRWQWLTREEWSNTGWALDTHREDPAHDRLALHKDAASGEPGWVTTDGSNGKAVGAILEWSPPPDPVAVNTFEREPWLEEVHRKIARGVEADLDEFAESRNRLLQEYQRAMGRLLRKESDDAGRDRRAQQPGPGPGGFRWPGGTRRMVEKLEEDLKAADKAGALLAALPDGVSEGLREQQKASETGLKLLEETYELRLKGHLVYYLTGMKKKAAELAEKGYLADSQFLRELITPLQGDLAAFVALLFADTPRAILPWTPQTDEAGNPEDADPREDDSPF